MTRDECRQLVDAYVDWLRRGISAERVGEACELTTPFLDRHNDHLQVYAVKRNGKIVLSDDGYILSDLRTSGLELNTPKRKAILDTALRGFGVQLDGRQLQVEASPRNLGQRVHSLVQAMLALNDMFVMAQPRVATFFWEDVRAFLDEHRVRYSPRVKLAGRTGYDHAIDFLIPRSPAAPERLVQAINAPGRNTIGSYLFVLGDTREARGEAAEAYAFLNDRDRDVGGDVIEALEAYHVKPALWSHREEFAEPLAA
ncbi:MAG: DUF1828 domain-containing protein [Alphaproteobacteria bacterium]|nr:DUF1828 domain-containing protein [Alphaproteobacteria bacterium]